MTRRGLIQVHQLKFVRFFNGQKTVSGKLPIETIIPAEDWVLKLRYEKAELQGYVTGVCTQLPIALTLCFHQTLFWFGVG